MELVITLPLLITFCLMGLDFGRFAYAYIVLGNAARVGAEVGATRSYSISTDAEFRTQVEDAVFEEFQSIGGLDPSNLTVSIKISTDDPRDPGLQRVTVTGAYDFHTVVTWPQMPQPVNLQRFVAYRRFR